LLFVIALFALFLVRGLPLCRFLVSVCLECCNLLFELIKILIHPKKKKIVTIASHQCLEKSHLIESLGKFLYTCIYDKEHCYIGVGLVLMN
jgi:hypothetical protein